VQLLAIVGEQFQVGDEVCGIVCSIRFNEDILSVWNKSADNKQARLKIQYVFFLGFVCCRVDDQPYG
jgi:translation initiation factor 4E